MGTFGMDLLQQTWEAVGMFFSSILRGFERSVTGVFGSSNARHVKRLQSRIDAINALEPKYEAMSEEELRGQTEKFRERLRAGETLEDLLPEAFAVCREGGKRFLQMRHYDVQLVGGMVLHSGSIAEMVTGEGKTLVATLPAYLNALAGSVHVITVNDYLARRDMEWMAPLYMGLGLTVGAIQSDMPSLSRQQAYACDITYGTNNEFGFDYLRDNMRPAARGDSRFPLDMQQSQGPLNFAIIDEVDNILIDEARTPLIISGPAHDDVRRYADADRIARQLQKETHFKVSEKDHSVTLTDEGVRQAEKLAGVESFYTAGNMEWPHMIDNALKAHHLYIRDVNYVVKDGKVIIVDDFTGRLMEGRQWSDGLHQAVEAKEGVPIKEETQTLATITLQNFFKLYNKLSGMTGTAMTEATEFWKIYKLDVVAIPTNRVLQRIEYPDVIYRNEKEKYEALADEIERINRMDVVVLNDHDEVMGEIVAEDDNGVTLKMPMGRGKETVPREKIARIERRGRPVLVGTVSIEKSERLSALLDKRGVTHQVLNAKFHKREAEIVAQAGRKGAVTIATNMAGRGTDIIMGGNPETMAWARLQDKYETRLDVPKEEWDGLVDEISEAENMKVEGQEVLELGGLHVIGTERHEARRIDLQLRGRCGRQGDAGSSRFFLSLEDDLMRVFAGPWVKAVLEKLGMTEGERIESRMVTRRIEAAQKKVEERNFESRKNLLEYDEVMDEQRKRVYGFRQQILDGANCREMILDMVAKNIELNLQQFLDPQYGLASFAAFAGAKLSAEFEPRDLRGMDYEQASAYVHDEAERQAETHVQGAIDENLPREEEESEWRWESLAKFANRTWGLNLRDRDLKKLPLEDVSEFLIEKAVEAIRRVDLSEGSHLLDADYGVRTVAAWLHAKFGLDIDWEQWVKDEAEPNVVIRESVEQAVAAYDEKEQEYPVMAGLYRFATGSGANSGIDRESLIDWAKDRFEVDITEDLRNKQRDEIRQVLLQHSAGSQRKAEQALVAVKEKVSDLFAGQPATATTKTVTNGNGALSSLTDWFKDNFNSEVSADEISDLDREHLEQKLCNAVEDRYRPEMRRLERTLLLRLVDMAWKDHLLAMDHLKHSIAFAGYAQMDPKVEYKREGMRMFDEMWDSLNDRVSELVFRIEQLDEGLVSSTWQNASAHKQEASSELQAAQQQQAASGGEDGEQRIEPIRIREQRVGRNDPCPCNSGKKYKNCCMNK